MMESSQESDISVATHMPSQGVAESQESLDLPANDGWRIGVTDLDAHVFNDQGTGPNHNLPRNASPLAFFSLFWDADITATIITESNR